MRTPWLALLVVLVVVAILPWWSSSANGSAGPVTSEVEQTARLLGNAAHASRLRPSAHRRGR
jgi:hypothetical protein